MTKWQKPDDLWQRITEAEIRVKKLETVVRSTGAIVTVTADPSTAPVGVPPGSVAARYNTTNNKLWVYNGSWRSVTFT